MRTNVKRFDKTTDKSSALIKHNILGHKKRLVSGGRIQWPDPKARIRSEYRSNEKTTKHKQSAQFTHHYWKVS